MSPTRTEYACCKHCGDMACPGGLDDHWVPCPECQPSDLAAAKAKAFSVQGGCKHYTAEGLAGLKEAGGCPFCTEGEPKPFTSPEFKAAAKALGDVLGVSDNQGGAR